jgi:hypothetical protein
VEKDDTSGFESARLEHCGCGSTEMKNNVYFCKGQKIKVYVQCARCGEYVARYTLTGYTSDEPYESLLRKLRFIRLSSGKRALKMVETFGDDVQEEFKHVLDLIRTGEDKRRMEEIIEKDYPDGLG